MKNKIINLLKNKQFMLIIGISIVLVIILLNLILIQKNKFNNITETLSNMEENIIQENLISNEIIADLTEETTEEQDEEILINSDKEISNSFSSPTNYYIKVNNHANVVTIYQKDANGNFNPIKAMICSTGTATPSSGVYSVKTKWVWGKLFGNVYGHYVTKIVGNILFHSVPYTAASPDSLEYWEYDKLGTSASMGCVRLCVRDSKWIFDNMPNGTPVEFYYDSDPGPLGKPGAQQISSNTDCRDWDPTDPDPANPWINYVAPASIQPAPNTNIQPSSNSEINNTNKILDEEKNNTDTFKNEIQNNNNNNNNNNNETIINNTNNNQSAINEI